MRLSIITATHNRPLLFKERCLPSILSQTHKDFEWIVVNDGNDPETQQVIDTLPTDLNIKYFGTPHSGLIASRNLALENATGDLISFLDDDNSLSENFVQEMIQFFQTNPTVMMSQPIRRQRRDVFEKGHRIQKGKEFLRPSPEATNEDFVKGEMNAIFDSNGFVHQKCAEIRFNSDLLVMSDYEYLLQCFSRWRLESLSICHKELVLYVQRSDGIIGQSSYTDWWKELEIISKHRNDYQIFETVDPDPWLQIQIEDAKTRASAGELLPGFQKRQVSKVSS